ncbi:MAG: hypothetical protein OXT67_09850 [Zetaproteobacteria bacterium]|nr:hypothetical protein [Zetaproteobacteria bacterium]
MIRNVGRYLRACAALLGIFSLSVQAATVTSISRKKKMIIIDEGREDGFIKGKKVCVFNSDKRVACGVVIRVKKNRAQVKINRDFLKVKKGFEVRIRGASKDDEPEYGPALRFLALPVPVGAPANYQLLTYLGANAAGEGSSSLWQSEESYTSNANALISFSVGVEFEQRYWQVRFGARVREYQSHKRAADYDLALPGTFLQTEQSASASGVYVDYFVPLLDGLDVGVGVDFDQTTMKFYGEVRDDFDSSYNERIYNLESSGLVTSLRLPVRYNSYLDPMGLSFGLTSMIPLYVAGLSNVAQANDTVHGSLVQDAQQDLVDSANFRAGGFTVEVALGLYLSL